MSDPRTTYDVSTADGPSLDGSHYPVVSQGFGATPEPDVPDTLELLRLRADEVVEIKTTTVETPTGHIRLVCRGNIDGREVQRWNRKALPPVARKSANPGAFDVDSRVLYTTVLTESCERVEVLGRDSQWKVVEDLDGNILTFKDPALLSVFGALDATGAIMKMFVLDSAITKAGQAVLVGAGWAEGSTGYDEDDDEDPTV